jgi:hypothetical protein
MIGPMYYAGPPDNGNGPIGKYDIFDTTPKEEVSIAGDDFWCVFARSTRINIVLALRF